MENLQVYRRNLQPSQNAAPIDIERDLRRRGS
jgi:hypothetical protein